MKIKRLEISGFKSFVDKTVFDFQQGVTAIVGPNGCGKSNVVDAMRWAMGEQSARNLRGRQMEDVIFGGCESRRPVGMAEVSLVFSTDDGRVPARYLGFSEIQVTRRLYRDGESDYLLNRTPCRLMDINELFMDTGVGARAYSVIEQGRIGMILHSKPEERRFLIEEAAGVTKFKVRKQVALKKIEATRQNLLRLADIIGEIRRQLGALQRQARKAESFKTLREELRGIEVALAGMEFRQLENDLGALTASLQDHEDRCSVLAAELAGGDLALEERRCRLQEVEQELAALQESCYRQRNEIQGEENRLELTRREIESLDRQAERAKQESAAIAESRRGALEEQALLRQSAEAAARELAGAADELRAAEDAVAALSEDELAAGQELEKLRGELFSILARCTEVVNRRTATGRRLEALAEGDKRREREAEALLLRHAEAEQLRDGAALRLSQVMQEKEDRSHSLARLKEETERFRKEMEEVRFNLQAAKEELTATSSRLASLKELEQQFAGYGAGVKAVMSSSTLGERFSGVLADLVEVEPSWEAAAEAVFSERLQYLVAKGNQAAVLDAVSHLKTQGGGRCGFLLGSPADAPSVPPPGCSLLADVVVARPPYAGPVERLLGSTCVADNLEEALELSRTHPGTSFVTRDGDLVSADGCLTCGLPGGVGDGLIHKKREIRELERQSTVLAERVGHLERTLEECRARLTSLGENVAGEEQELHRVDLQVLTQEKDLARFRDECERIVEMQSLRTLEDRQFAAEREELAVEEKRAREQEAELLLQRARHEDSVAACTDRVEAKRRELALARDRLTSVKVQAAALGEKRDAQLRGIERLEARLLEIAGREVAYRKDAEEAAASRELLGAKLEAGTLELRRRHEGLQVLEEQLQKAKYSWEELSEEVRTKETALRQVRGEHEEMSNKGSEARLRRSELALRREHLMTILQERHCTSPDEAMEAAGKSAVSHQEADQRLAVLRRQLDELGEVNLAALEDYRQMEERHGFLVGQKADLEESLQGLQKAIAKINRTTRKRFLETFTQVNERFKELFPRLFCGGSAELRLTDEEDLLETGIDIIVQPPGKKLQNVSLLSGGEKALTAVALIFAIFQIKPSPFCLLDEVDAPLDEANIGRFNELVREMSQWSQFIMITHSKATMAVADVLYGITMEEAGVSKVVSVNLSGGSGG